MIPQILINLDPGTTFNPYESWEAEQAPELQANAVKTITEYVSMYVCVYVCMLLYV
jgi:hypothetical protein